MTRGNGYCAGIMLLLAGWVLAGCGREDTPPPPEMPSQDVMQDAPLYYPSRAVRVTSAADAVEMTYRTATPPESLAAWYRTRILQLGWDIVGDAPGADGGVVLTVHRAGPPLWVIIQPDSVGEGSVFSLIGAAPDTTAPQP